MQAFACLLHRLQDKNSVACVLHALRGLAGASPWQTARGSPHPLGARSLAAREASLTATMARCMSTEWRTRSRPQQHRSPEPRQPYLIHCGDVLPAGPAGSWGRHHRQDPIHPPLSTPTNTAASPRQLPSMYRPTPPMYRPTPPMPNPCRPFQHASRMPIAAAAASRTPARALATATDSSSSSSSDAAIAGATAPPFPLTPEQQHLSLLLTCATPRVLEFDRGLDEPPPSLRGGVGLLLLRVMGFYSHKSKLLHGGQRLYGAITEHVDRGTLQKAFGLDPAVFFSTYALLALHVWLCLRRLAAATAAGHVPERDARFFRQRFYMQFNADVGYRVQKAGVEVGARKWLKKLEQMFFSMSLALDKALQGEGNESVVDVLLIEMYGGDTTYRHYANVLAQYLQYELSCLEGTRTEALLQGHIRFSDDMFRDFVRAKAPHLKPPLA